MAVTIALILCVFVATCDGQNNQSNCGKRKVNHRYLIQQGEVSTRGSWPWYAAIYHRKQNISTYQCGGSIIGQNTILTAAHCVQLDKDAITVRVGHVNLNVMNSQPGYSVSKVIVNPQFVDREHDIAVLILLTDIAMDQYVQPICLWSMDDHVQIVGKTGTVVGFGYNEQDKVSPFLKETTLTVVDGYTCVANDEGYRAVLTPNMYCAGGRNGSSPCNGDSGGGMYFQKEGTWYVRGLVSFGAQRPNTIVCDASKYTVFTFVSKYIGWLASIHRRSSSTHLEPTKETVIGTKDITSKVANRYEHGFLLATKYDRIIRVPLNGSKSSIIFVEYGIQGKDHDCAEGRFYWCNDRLKQILSSKYDGTDPKSFMTKDIIDPARVAVDWISRRLYWTDWLKNTIEVASLENPDVRTVLISEDLSYPFSIAVDPLTSKMYWTKGENGPDMIEWANLDGSERQVLVSSPQIENVLSIKVSRGTGELCYADNHTKIECIDPHSKRIRTIASNLTDPRAFAITDQLFYWIEWNMNAIESIDQNGVRQKPITSLDFDFRYSSEMTAVTDNCPLSYSPCAINNGDCPVNTICLVNPSVPAGRSCVVRKKCIVSFSKCEGVTLDN